MDCNCSGCKIKSCRTAELEKLPKGCVTLKYKRSLDIGVKEYETKKAREIFKTAAEIEVKGYMRWPRLMEIIEFCKRLNLRKIGIAFCVGLSWEAAQISEILENNGFEVSSVVCKVGAISKKELGIPSLRGDASKEAACNPIGQAEILNKENTELNLIVGLCVGHDILFSMYSKAPVTTLIVKDRVLGHNPAAALYSSYYQKIFRKEK
ncbi:MAG: DUF1847 domain-containing protein [Candidatus Odinarchaeia archaeon]